jgi:integrase
MATVKAIIRRKGEGFIVNKHNQCLILLQYQYRTRCCWFSTKIKVKPECWNSNKQAVDKTKGISDTKINNELMSTLEKESKLCNALIEKMKSRINSIAWELTLKEVEPTAYEVKALYEERFGKSELKEEPQMDFMKLFDDYIESQKSLKADSTISQYRSVYNNLLSFEKIKKEKITLDNINSKLYERLVKYFMEDHPMRAEEGKGMNNNSIGTQIKRLKVFLAHLKKEGLINTDLSDFKVFKETPEIIFLTHEEIDILYRHKFTDEKLSTYRDLFILQCFTSLRVSDLHRLGKQNIQGDVIRMRAHKTRRNISIPLFPVSKEILEKYNYELPKFYDQHLNEHIKTCCKLCGIDSEIELQETKGGKKIYKTYKKWELISTHIGVKTFITLMLQSGMQVKEVAEIVGKSTKVIDQHYHGLDNKIVLNKAQNAFNGK